MRAQALSTRISKWGEGPVWWDHKLTYVDIEGQNLVSYDPQSGAEQVWHVGQRIGFALPCASGRWIWGGDHGLFFIDLTSGISTPITDPEADLPDNRFNDAAISPDGRLFAGTISLKKITGTANLYRMDQDLSCRVVIPQVTNSNGIAWSPDGKTCYYIDTPTYNIYQFEYDTESGALLNSTILLNTKVQYSGSPDGMCVDADGKLWIAFCHGGAVIRWDPNSKTELAKIGFPTAETTSLCFGGPGLADLYVSTGLNPKQPEEQAGKIFVIKETSTKGIAQVAFQDL